MDGVPNQEDGAQKGALIHTAKNIFSQNTLLVVERIL